MATPETAPRDVAVYCSGLTKAYGTGETSVMALRGVDLEVRTGELLMVVGPSGCGKTTLVSIIAGLLDRDGGRCDVLGQDLQEMDRTSRALFRRKSMGFVFQSFNLLPGLNVVENVAIPLLLERLSRQRAEAGARETLDLVGLDDRADARPAQLSGGQQQRVAIARALGSICSTVPPKGSRGSWSSTSTARILPWTSRGAWSAGTAGPTA